MSNASNAFFWLAVVGLVASCGGGSSGGDPTSGGPPDSNTGDGASTSEDDGGASGSDAAATDPGIYDTPTVCTSNKTWTRGDHGSSSMHPGGTCVSCHAAERGPRLTIGGTVYPTAHEPDDCNGSSGGVKVVITDAKGKTTSLAVNSAGNFYSDATIAMPFQAKVVSGTKERVMTAAQTSGDCNSCHTEAGTKDAPGRIMAP